jgi:hypothetical protein
MMFQTCFAPSLFLITFVQQVLVLSKEGLVMPPDGLGKAKVASLRKTLILKGLELHQADYTTPGVLNADHWLIKTGFLHLSVINLCRTCSISLVFP